MLVYLSLPCQPLAPQCVKFAEFLALNTRSKGAVTCKRGPSQLLLFRRQPARTQEVFGMCRGASESAIFRVDGVNTAIARLSESAFLISVRRQARNVLAEFKCGSETTFGNARMCGEIVNRFAESATQNAFHEIENIAMRAATVAKERPLCRMNVE
jgi:hypothetical protein